MGGYNYRRQNGLDPQRHINVISSVKQVKASSHRVSRSGEFDTIEMNGGDTNAVTGSDGRN